MRQWTVGELKVLRLFASLGVEGVSMLLDRSPASVSRKAAELRVSLKVTGEDIDITEEVASLLARIVEPEQQDICPMCGRRWATMPTGICRVCHLDRLIELHREQADIEERQRRLTAARQEKRRRRLCEDCGGNL